mmetsp:Transcript_111349/g.311170  ORF Transcript_111349/g.311170 Transcript_111349/m.311170 type:complete len:232 (-) Transcript_111349:22-717(-)
MEQLGVVRRQLEDRAAVGSLVKPRGELPGWHLTPLDVLVRLGVECVAQVLEVRERHALKEPFPRKLLGLDLRRVDAAVHAIEVGHQQEHLHPILTGVFELIQVVIEPREAFAQRCHGFVVHRVPEARERSVWPNAERGLKPLEVPSGERLLRVVEAAVGLDLHHIPTDRLERALVHTRSDGLVWLRPANGHDLHRLVTFVDHIKLRGRLHVQIERIGRRAAAHCCERGRSL